MSIFKLNDDASIDRIETNGLRVKQISNVRGAGEIKLNDHLVSLIGSESRVTARIAGKLQAEEHVDGGTALFLPAGCDLRSEHDRSWHGVAIRLPDHLFRTAADGMISYSRISFRHGDVRNPAIPPLVESMRNATITGLFTEWPMLAESMTLSLTVAIISAMSPEALIRQAGTDALHGARKQRVTEYIEANLFRSIALEELANVAQMGLYDFARKFKRSHGVTPMRYVWTRRVEEAKRLLRRPGMPLAQVSFEAGFSSQAHFTTAFKAATGKTPAAWRAALSLAASLFGLAHMVSEVLM